MEFACLIHLDFELLCKKQVNILKAREGVENGVSLVAACSTSPPHALRCPRPLLSLVFLSFQLLTWPAILLEFYSLHLKFNFSIHIRQH